MKKQSVSLRGRKKEVNKAIGFFLSLCLLFTVGCFEKEADNDKFNLLRSVVENGTAFSIHTYLGTVEAAEKDKVVGYLSDAATVIQTAADSGKIEPEVFKKYVNNQIKEKIAAPYGPVIVTTLDLAIDGYNKFYAANVKGKIENEPKAKAIIEAIVSGIHSGSDLVSSVADATNPLEGEVDWNL